MSDLVCNRNSRPSHRITGMQGLNGHAAGSLSRLKRNTSLDDEIEQRNPFALVEDNVIAAELDLPGKPRQLLQVLRFETLQQLMFSRCIEEFQDSDHNALDINWVICPSWVEKKVGFNAEPDPLMTELGPGGVGPSAGATKPC